MTRALHEKHQDGAETVLFDCPGCGMLHAPVVAVGSGPERPCWTWNGSVARPTFTPSILVRCDDYGPEHKNVVCHSFVTDGRIQFLGDCTHDLAGQTVDLPEFP